MLLIIDQRQLPSKNLRAICPSDLSLHWSAPGYLKENEVFHNDHRVAANMAEVRPLRPVARSSDVSKPESEKRHF